MWQQSSNLTLTILNFSLAVKTTDKGAVLPYELDTPRFAGSWFNIVPWGSKHRALPFIFASSISKGKRLNWLRPGPSAHFLSIFEGKGVRINAVVSYSHMHLY